MDIVSTGLMCAVGLTAETACAAMRARVAGFNDLPFRDNDGEPIVGAAVPDIDPALKRGERLVALLAPALEACLESGSIEPTKRIPLLVGLSESERPGGGGAFASTIVADIAARLDVSFDPKRSATFPRGHVSSFEALRRARELMEDPSVPACLVCGVDSYVNARSLEWLDRHSRLKTTRNSDGLIPGEAAACVLVVRPEREPRGGCVARVAGLGFGQEEAAIMTEEPLLGLGMAAAGRAALKEAGRTMNDVALRVADVGGESYGFREQGLLLCRLLKDTRECTPLWHASESLGETGAAAGVIALIMVHQAFRKRYAPGPLAACTTASDGGGRATAVVERRLAKEPDSRATRTFSSGRA